MALLPEKTHTRLQLRAQEMLAGSRQHFAYRAANTTCRWARPSPRASCEAGWSCSALQWGSTALYGHADPAEPCLVQQREPQKVPANRGRAVLVFMAGSPELDSISGSEEQDVLACWKSNPKGEAALGTP